MNAMINVEDFYPLTPMQEGMLFHSLYAPESEVYFEQLHGTLTGELDQQAFRRMFQEVVDRHPALRTAFVWEGLDQPVQVVHATARIPWQDLDWRGQSTEEQRQNLQDFLHRDRGRGFDFARPPLMRMALCRLEDEVHELVWSFHHILLDGWSLATVLKEALALYEAYRLGRELRLERSRPFRDYIVWLKRQDLSAAESYWRTTLGGFRFPTNVRFDRTARGVSGNPCGIQVVQLSESATANLETWAGRHRLSLNTLVQGAWALALSRNSGETDVVFGAVSSGRPSSLPGVDAMVGLFINTLPLRVQVQPNERLLPWLKKLQTQAAESRLYEYSPLAEVQRWSDVSGGLPLFEGIVAFENFKVDDSLRHAQLSLQMRDLELFERTNYGYGLLVGPGKEMRLKLMYDRRRYDDAFAGMAQHLQNLLQGMPAHDDCRLGELPFTTEAEDRQLLAWSSTESSDDEPELVHELFAAHAVESPEKSAVEFQGARLTYAELNSRSNRVADHLQELGVGPEVRVGLFLDPSLELVAVVLGILKAGGTCVPLDSATAHSGRAPASDGLRVPIVLTEQRLASSITLPGAKIVFLASVDEQVTTTGMAKPRSRAASANVAIVSMHPGAVVQRASMILYEGLWHMTRAFQSEYGVNADQRVLQWTSCDDGMSLADTVSALACGATVCLAATEMMRDSAELHRTLREKRITWARFTPTVLSTLSPADLPELSTVLSWGEKCPTETVSHWVPRGKILNCYGTTESSRNALVHDCEYSPQADAPLGRPIRNTHVAILDRHLEPVPIGVTGELYLGGRGLARGYDERPGLTAEAFIPDAHSERSGGWLCKTGDLGRWRPDGTIEFLGRLDSRVRISGLSIDVQMVEQRLEEHPLVRHCIIRAQPSDTAENRLVASVVPDGAAKPTAVELRQFLRTRLPDSLIPALIVILDALPLLPNGKVDRRSLSTPTGDQQAQIPIAQLAAHQSPHEEMDELCELTNLTKNQFLVWAGQKAYPDVPLYNVAAAYLFSGAVDVGHFRRAFQALLEGCDALRTVVEEIDGLPQQRVLP